MENFVSFLKIIKDVFLQAKQLPVRFFGKNNETITSHLQENNNSSYTFLYHPIAKEIPPGVFISATLSI